MTDKINPQNCKSCLREGCYFHPSRKKWREGMTDGMDISPIKISTFTERYGCGKCIPGDTEIEMHPCNGCICMLDDNLGCPEMKTCLDYQMCRVAEITKRKERSRILTAWDVWVKNALDNHIISKDAYIEGLYVIGCIMEHEGDYEDET